MINTFGTFWSFSKKRPEYVEKVGLNYCVANSEGSDRFFEVGGHNHEEVDDVFVGTGVSVGLLCQIGNESYDEFVSDSEQFYYIWFCRIF